MRKVWLVAAGAIAVAIGLVVACGSDPTNATSSPDSATMNSDGTFSEGTTTETTDTGAETSTDSGAGTADAAVDADADADADADVDAGAFTPTALGARVVLWLEGDSFGLVDGGVKWPDKSAMGNHARQDAATRMPVLVDGSTDGAVNGHGVVRFAGHEFLRIEDSPSLQWGTVDFGFYVVMLHHNSLSTLPEFAIVYAKWSDTNPSYPGFFMWANYPASTAYVSRLDTNQTVSSDGGKNDGVARLVAARRVGSNFELRLGGNQVELRTDASIPDASAFNAPGLPAVIGGRPTTIQQLQGDIAEIIAVKGTLTDEEQTALENYLKAKYGL